MNITAVVSNPFFFIYHTSGYPTDLPPVLCPLILHWHYFDNRPPLFFSATSPLFLSSLSVRLPFTFHQTYNSSSAGGGVPSLPASSQKRLDDSTARFTNANFQEVSSTHSSSGSKDGLAADPGKAVPEVKNKKNSGGSHAVGQRGGRKSLTSSGKPLPSAVVTMATSSTSASASTGPFHQGELMAAKWSQMLIWGIKPVFFFLRSEAH